MFPRMRWELRAAGKRTNRDGRARGGVKCQKIKSPRRKIVRAGRNALARNAQRENPAADASSVYVPNHFFKTELVFPASPACRAVPASTKPLSSARPTQIPRVVAADQCVRPPLGRD